MTLDNSGNLLVGTTSAFSPLTVNGLNRFDTATFGDIATGGNNCGIYLRSSGTAGISWAGGGTLAFYGGGVGSTERARIDSSGNLGIGKTTTTTSDNGISFQPAGNGANIPFASLTGASTSSGSTSWATFSSTGGVYKFYVGYDGTIHATSTTISAISDQRLKENVRDLDVGLAEIMAVKPRRFDWKEGKGLDKKDDVGFIAQEFETVFPNSVDLSKAGEDGIEYKAINHSELIPTLVKAIQELKAEFDAYKATHP